MSDASEHQARLWAIIVSYGFEEEYERDWLGRIRSRRTKRQLRTEISPELAQLLTSGRAQLDGIARSAKAVIAAPEEIRRALFKQETDLPG